MVEPQTREREETVFQVVQDRIYFLYGFGLALVVVWALNGWQGEIVGWLMLAAVIIYVLFARKKKQSLPTIGDVIIEIVQDYKARGLYLSPYPKYIIVKQLGKNRYAFEFTQQRKTVVWEGRLARGARELRDISADSIQIERHQQAMDLKDVDLEEIN